jgi:glutathione S-transferase
MKLETYLRMAGLAYQVTVPKALSRSPTGKAPFIEIDGVVMSDSGLIISHLERTNGHPVDGKLTLAERGVSLAMQRMIEEHLYWAAVYMRWVDPATRTNWTPHLKELLNVPGFAAPFVTRMAARGIMKDLKSQGLGRHPPDVIWKMGIADIQAVAHWLGNRPWGFGDTPTTFDACLAAMVANIVCTPWQNPLTAALLKHGSLISHWERIMARYFPDLAAPTG